MRELKRRIGLVLLSGLWPVVVLAAANQMDVQLQKAQNWLVIHQGGLLPIGGGWHIGKITIEAENVHVYVNVPSRQAKTMMKKNSSDHQKIIKSICPNMYQEVWNYLKPQQSIIYHFMMKKEIFFEATCPKE